MSKLMKARARKKKRESREALHRRRGWKTQLHHLEYLMRVDAWVWGTTMQQTCRWAGMQAQVGFMMTLVGGGR